jgi:hypothetical protein
MHLLRWTIETLENVHPVCNILDGGRQEQMPLSGLKVEPDNPNLQMVDDFLSRHSRREGQLASCIERKTIMTKAKTNLTGRWSIQSILHQGEGRQSVCSLRSAC